MQSGMEEIQVDSNEDIGDTYNNYSYGTQRHGSDLGLRTCSFSLGVVSQSKAGTPRTR